MKTPPSLVSLTIDSAVLNLSDISDLSPIPDHILLDLFLVFFLSPPSLSLSYSNFILDTVTISKVSEIYILDL
jgi:reversibly glycosylated polypeptide/UDP-arabinopyranose mutase